MLSNSKTLLITAVLAANLFVCGMFVYVLSASRHQREDEIRTSVENVALLLDVSVTEAFNKVDLSLRSSADELNEELRRHGRLDGQEVNALLVRRRDRLSSLAVTLRVTDASGKLEYCSGCPAGDESSLARGERLPMREGHEESGLIVSGLLLDPLTNERFVLFSRSYQSPDGRFAGFVSASVPARSFARFFANLDLGPHGVALLRDANLAVIFASIASADPNRLVGSTAHSQELADIVASGVRARTYHTTHAPDAIERELAYRRLVSPPFSLVVGKATEDYLTEWRGAVWKAIAAEAIFLAGSLSLVWLMWRAELANKFNRLLLRNASDGIHILDPRQNLIEASDAFCTMLGYTRAEMLGMNVAVWDTKFTDPGPHEFMVKIDGPSEITTFEARHRRKDGSILDVEITVRPLMLAGRPMFFCSSRDITERKRNEQRLIESELRFRRFFEQNCSVMLITDPSSGLIVDANRAASSYYGYGIERLVGMALNEIAAGYPEEANLGGHLGFRRTFGPPISRHVLASGDVQLVEIHSGPVDIDGKSLICTIVHDVTQRHAAEARAERLSNLYATLSQCNQAIVHSTDETDMFARICRCAVEYGFAKTAWIGLVDTVSRQIVPVAKYGQDSDLGFLEYLPLTVDESGLQGRFPSARAIRSNEPQWSQDFLGDPTTEPWHEWGRQVGWKSIASLPLCRNSIPVGCLVIYSDVIAAFDEEVRALLTEMATDITFAMENFAREAHRRQLENRYSRVFQYSRDLISINRVSDGIYVDVNAAFVEFSGFSREEVIGHSSLELNVWLNADSRRLWIDMVRHKDGCRNMEFPFRKKTGEVLWGSVSSSLIELEGDTCILSVVRDISDIKTAEEEIRGLAFYDPLTHLPNRRLLTERLNQAVASALQNNRKCALLFINLDNFKMLTDSAGQEVGELLIQEVANRITNLVREPNTVARWKGDEFIVLIKNLGEKIEEAAAQAQGLAEDMLSAIALPFLLAGREHRSTISIGITIFGSKHESPDDLITQADIAMYQAKTAGRNTLRFFSPDLQTAISERAAMETDLHRAVETEQFLLYYQPQIDQNSLVGAEVLIRWRHPERGMISPASFIPLAEETGLILRLGSWVLETACRQIAEWCARQDTRCITLAVNVSALQFRQADFVENILATLERTGANPQNLKLELTESMLADNIEEVIGKMTTLRSRGITFSLDDFGTGFSSLSYLKRLPLDQLKIDGSFVKDILTDTNDATIATTIVALGQAMGLSVIAEGVETEAQRDFLLSLGCSAFQGYLYGRPLPLQDFQALLQS